MSAAINHQQDFPPLRLARVDARVFRVPVAEPVQTSFGIMYDRPAVLVRVEDRDGYVGWGEIWCNFPEVGAEHRARMLETCVAPILLERSWTHPAEAFREATRRLHILAIQTGEPGTIAQAIAGADIALWDLLGKRLGQPLWKLLGGAPRVAVYASGLSPTGPEKLAAAKRAEGFTAFKLKVGFGAERDLDNLRALRALLGPDTTLMVDANQAWDRETAREMSARMADFKLEWLEEPMAADVPLEDWKALAEASPIALAGGENLRGEAAFSAAVSSSAFSVIQPDLGKWGGFSGCLEVAKEAHRKGIRFCPHWLGGGIGLIASMHLKAAAGGPGWVEVDSNPNPLRELLAACPPVRDGSVELADLPGLGTEPDFERAEAFLVPHRYADAAKGK